MDILLPINWSELTEEQLIQVSSVFLGNKPKEEFLLICFHKLSGCRPLTKLEIKKHNLDGEEGDLFWYRNDEGTFLMSDATIAAACDMLSFLLSKPEPMVVPSLPGRITPDQYLWMMPFERFWYSTIAYKRYMENRDIAWLQKLVDELYPVSDHHPHQVHLRPEQLYAVFLWYSAFRIWSSTKWPNLFPVREKQEGEEDDDSDLFRFEEEVPDDEQFLNMIAAFNQGNPANNDKLKQTNCHEIFFQFERLIEQQREMQSEGN